MKHLIQPGTKILLHQDEMMKHLATHTDNGYDKDKLGYLVKYYGGDKIVKVNNKLLICKLVEEADYEEIDD